MLYLFADVLTLPVFLTTPLNKAPHMDPHVSRLVRPVTEYSATQGSSGCSSGHCPGMETARILLALKQGQRSLVDYIQEYLAIAYYSDLPDCLLIDFFCDGINQPLRYARVRVHHSLSFWIMLC